MTRRIKDEYEIIAELGAGGMATVYKANQKSLNRPVAIKELKKSYHSDGMIVQRFEREAQLAASFQHENIVHIYDYGRKPEYCIVMEYVDGTSLERIIREMGPLPTDVGVMIALQVANALEYAHVRGLIHRDIKPGNIMVKRNGEVKVMDFGIALAKNLDSLTLPGTLIGTPSYMSPEQALGEPLDLRSDIFSFGIVLYELFTGMKPFQDDKTASLLANIAKSRYRSPRRVNSDIPRSIQRIIRKCMKRKPAKRYGSMLAASNALGKRVKGTSKAASLKRISDYLVQAKLVEPPLPDETLAIHRVPGYGVLVKMGLTAVIVLVLIAGAFGYYTWIDIRTERMRRETPAMGRSAPGTVSAPTTTAVPSAHPTVSSGTTPTSGKKSEKSSATP